MTALYNISQICIFISSKKLAKVRSNQRIFKCYLNNSQSFSHFRILQVRAYAIHVKLSYEENFRHNISHKRGFRFDPDKCFVNNMERPFFPTEIEARRELARPGLIKKHHYHPELIQFSLLNGPRWQSNKEAKQGRFHLDRYDSFGFQVSYITQRTMIGSQMPQTTHGLTVQDKILNTNIKSSTQ